MAALAADDAPERRLAAWRDARAAELAPKRVVAIGASVPGVECRAWRCGDAAVLDADVFLIAAPTVAEAVVAARGLARRPGQTAVVAGPPGVAAALESCDFEVAPSSGVAAATPLAAERDPRFEAQREILAFGDLRVVQSPRGADGFGGLVWPNAVAFATWLVGRGAPLGRVLELGAGTGFLGLALVDAGAAAAATLTDEFVGLAAHNAAAFLRNRPDAAVDVRRLRWGDADDAPGAFDTVVGAELTPMDGGHTALASELARHRRSVLALSPCPSRDPAACSRSPPCATHKFLAVARASRVALADLVYDAPAAAPTAGLDLTFADDSDVFWVAAFEGAAPG